MLSPEENPRDLGTQRLGSGCRKARDALLPPVSSGLTLRCPPLCQDVFKGWGWIGREAAPNLVGAFSLEGCANVQLDPVSWCSRPWGSPARCPGCSGSHASPAGPGALSSSVSGSEGGCAPRARKPHGPSTVQAGPV